jgi:hypothetical protein
MILLAMPSIDTKPMFDVDDHQKDDSMPNVTSKQSKAISARTRPLRRASLERSQYDGDYSRRKD